MPKHGVAVTGDAPITLPRAVEAESAEGRALLDAVQPAFNREERLMLARDPELKGERGQRLRLLQELFDWRPGAQGD